MDCFFLYKAQTAGLKKSFSKAMDTNSTKRAIHKSHPELRARALLVPVAD